jgi:hypothetical protein
MPSLQLPQAVHEPAAPALNVPGAQSTQLVPVPFEWVPAGQSLHDADPAADTVPAGHGEHVPAPAGANEPAEHWIEQLPPPYPASQLHPPVAAQVP